MRSSIAAAFVFLSAACSHHAMTTMDLASSSSPDAGDAGVTTDAALPPNPTDAALGDATVPPPNVCVQLGSCCANRETLIPPEMQGKVYTGYQGWFRTVSDGTMRGWSHWGLAPLQATATSTNLTIDLWPDITEYTSSGLDNLQMSGAANATGPITMLGNGMPSQLFTSDSSAIVDTHLSWMQKYGISGAFVQRFIVDESPSSNAILQDVQASAEKYGRQFVVMYDITQSWSNPACYINGGVPDASQGSANPNFSIATCVEADMQSVMDLGVTSSSAYLKVTVGGTQKPLVAIFGYGLSAAVSGGSDGSNYIYNTTDGQALITWLKGKGFAVMGGVPTYWASAKDCGGFFVIDSFHDTICDALTIEHDLPSWSGTYAMFDIISPWLVGRELVPSDIDSQVSATIESDICTVQASGQGYLPVIYPGYSFFNTPRATGTAYTSSTFPLNQVPRACGKFFWKQFADFSAVGPDSYYVAMFDEMNEGTAIFKTAPTAATSPRGAQMVTLDAEGCDLTSDWYLQTAKAIASGSAVLSSRLGAPPTETFPLPLAAKTFPAGTTLAGGASLRGPGVTLTYATSGDLSLTDPYGTVLWHLGASHSCATGCQMVFQNDGNVVLSASGTPYDATNTATAQIGLLATTMTLLDHFPYFELLDAAGDVVWSTSGTFAPGLTLSKGQFIQFGAATTTTAYLQLGTDGNLALYAGLQSKPGAMLWSTKATAASCTAGCSATFLADGELVVDAGTTQVFSTNTRNQVGKPPFASRLTMLGQAPWLEVTDSTGTVLWSAVP